MSFLSRNRAEFATFAIALAMIAIFKAGYPALSSCLMAIWALNLADDVDKYRNTLKQDTPSND